MNLLQTRKYTLIVQYIISVAVVLLVSVACYVSMAANDYKIIALILLMCVSLLAMLFEMLPVLVAAILSAFIWNYIFIPPVFTLHIDDAGDLLMFLLYFVIAMVNAVLTSRIRKAEIRARDKEEKENTIRLYNTLLSSLSHELRTPIATITGAVDTLREETTLSPALQGELLNQIGEASERLNRQVENLLNMSRLETGSFRVNRDWCDTTELIYSVIQKEGADGHLVRFTHQEELPFFKLDRGLIEQVLKNLLHNAVHYTPPGSVVEITARHENERCIIEISDNGPGIPPRQLKNIFDKFYRLPGTKTGGSGLGLSIARGFVEAHNGFITAGNRESGGAKFIITIPAAASYISSLKNE